MPTAGAVTAARKGAAVPAPFAQPRHRNPPRNAARLVPGGCGCSVRRTKAGRRSHVPGRDRHLEGGPDGSHPTPGRTLATATGVRTPDLGGHAGTTEFTDEVISRVRTKIDIWASL